MCVLMCRLQLLPLFGFTRTRGTVIFLRDRVAKKKNTDKKKYHVKFLETQNVNLFSGHKHTYTHTQRECFTAFFLEIV